MARAAVPGGLKVRRTWRPASLVERRPETESASTLVLEVPGWPGHLAGQHVDVRLTAPDGYQAARSYSLAAPKNGDRIEITVQRVADGEVSSYLADDARSGDSVEVRGPVGGWFVWKPENSGPVLLVAGGSGVVPLMAMIRSREGARTIHRSGSSTRCVLPKIGSTIMSFGVGRPRTVGSTSPFSTHGQRPRAKRVRSGG